ncbi:unnamed protein product [Adineta ricciae]|uniref:Uncharacterized protein n=1 Tax=Adineta ricciae TaxID=249248 RepID=A0A814F510_ADIRI|nr:unnamed protein product [Adineta ricciae]
MHIMSLFKVIVILLVASVFVIESRPYRKRRQDVRSSAYYGSGPGGYSNIRYNLGLFGLGANLQPIGNNWFVPGMPQNPFYYPMGYNLQSYAYPNSFNAYGTGQYGGSGSPYPDDLQAYIGQSYVPQNNEWLPLPGVNRRSR